MPINHSKKLIFIHIPKTGGTSVAHVLGMFPRTGSHKKDLNTLYGIDNDGLVLQSMPFSYYEKFLSQDILSTYKKFTIVRNPYSRAVSEHNMFRDFRYSDKSILTKLKNLETRILKGENSLYSECKKLRQMIFLDYLNVVKKTLKENDKDTIVKYNQKGLPTHHNHFLPQYEHIKSDKYKIDHILKIENLKKDFVAIDPKINVPFQNKGKKVVWQDYYTPEHFKIVNEIYGIDFEKFNYEMISSE